MTGMRLFASSIAAIAVLAIVASACEYERGRDKADFPDVCPDGTRRWSYRCEKQMQPPDSGDDEAGGGDEGQDPSADECCTITNPCGLELDAICQCPGEVWDGSDCFPDDGEQLTVEEVERCCSPQDLCGWAENNACDCGPGYPWDASDCRDANPNQYCPKSGTCRIFTCCVTGCNDDPACEETCSKNVPDLCGDCYKRTVNCAVGNGCIEGDDMDAACLVRHCPDLATECLGIGT